MTAQKYLTRYIHAELYGQISADADLREDLRLDRLHLMSLAHDIWEATGTDISDEEIDRWRFVRDIEETLERVVDSGVCVEREKAA